MNKKQIIISCFSVFSFIFCFIFFNYALAQSPTAHLTLTWSTDTYVPADYPAKALPVSQSLIEVVAVADESTSPQKLYYTWFLNNYLQESQSGQGKQVFSFRADGINNRPSIKAVVRNEQKEFLAEKEIIIKIVEPEVVISKLSYNNNIKQTSRAYYLKSQSTALFSAKPYFFNIKKPDQLNYLWQFGEEKAQKTNEQKPNLLEISINQTVENLSRKLMVWAEDKNNSLLNNRSSVEIIIN